MAKPSPREMLNERVIRSRYDISAYDIVALPVDHFPIEMVQWLSSTEYIHQKLSYPAYCEIKGCRMELGPGAHWIAGKLDHFVRDKD